MKTIKEIIIYKQILGIAFVFAISLLIGCMNKAVENNDSLKNTKIKQPISIGDTLKTICELPIDGDGEGRIIINEDTNQPLRVVETWPEFPGGIDSLQIFLKRNLIYPNSARHKDIQGTVFITFVIEKTGEISNIKILRGIGFGCDEEAVRIVKAMPRWKPGKNKGTIVPVQFNMPIKFGLDKN